MRPALLAAYGYVSISLTDTPSMDAMLMTFAKRSFDDAARSSGASAWVRKNGVFMLRSTVLSQPLSGNSSNSAPQAAPALFTKMSSFDSRLEISATSEAIPSCVDTSPGIEMHSPYIDNSLAAASHCAALRAVMYTREQPCSRNPCTIIAPIPRDPPVTRATLPFNEKMSFMRTRLGSFNAQEPNVGNIHHGLY